MHKQIRITVLLIMGYFNLYSQPISEMQQEKIASEFNLLLEQEHGILSQIKENTGFSVSENIKISHERKLRTLIYKKYTDMSGKDDDEMLKIKEKYDADISAEMEKLYGRARNDVSYPKH